MRLSTSGTISQSNVRCLEINAVQFNINTNLSVLWSRFGFIRCTVHARRSRGNRRRGAFFHDVGRHLLWEVSFEIVFKKKSSSSVSSIRVNAVMYVDTVPDMNGYPHEVSRDQLVRQWCHSLWFHRLPAVVATACLSVVLVLFISPTARERLVWNFPNFLSHSNFLPISVRDTRPEGRMARGRRPSIGCLAFERVANGARPGLGHNRDCLQSFSLHINT